MNSKNPIVGQSWAIMRMSLVWLTLTTISVGVSAQDKEAPGAPRLLPQDTLAYIRLDNAEQFRTDFGSSSVGQMMNDPALKPLSNEVYQMLAEVFQTVGNVLEVSLDELLASPQGQAAAALMPGNLSEYQEELAADEEDDESPEAIRRRIARKRREQNSLAGLVMIDAAKNVDTLMGLMDKMEARITTQGYIKRSTKMDGTEMIKLLPPRPGRPEIEYFEKDGTMVMGFGHDTAAKVLEHWNDKSDEETLADRSDFVSIMSRCVGAESTRPQTTFFIDPHRITERLVKQTPAAALVWPIIEQLGLPKLRGIGGSTFSGGEIFEAISHMHILIDPPRDGVLGVLRPEVVESTPPKWIPADAASYNSIKWDFETSYKNLDKVISQFQGEDSMARFVEEPIKQQFGISFKEDLLDNITGRLVLCGWIEPTTRLNSQTNAIAIEIKDGLKAKNLIAKFRENQPNALEVETIGGTVVYFARTGRQGDSSDDNRPANLRRPEPGLMILGDWFIFSDSRQMLTRVTQANAGSIPRLINVPEFELVTSELGGKLDGEKPFLLSFLRGSAYMKQVYDLAKSNDTRGMLRQASANAPFVGQIVDMLDRNQLPDFEEFEKYFAPSGTFAYDEPSGIHFGSFTLRADD